MIDYQRIGRAFTPTRTQGGVKTPLWLSFRASTLRIQARHGGMALLADFNIDTGLWLDYRLDALELPVLTQLSQTPLGLMRPGMHPVDGWFEAAPEPVDEPQSRGIETRYTTFNSRHFELFADACCELHGSPCPVDLGINGWKRTLTLVPNVPGECPELARLWCML